MAHVYKKPVPEVVESGEPIKTCVLSINEALYFTTAHHHPQLTK